VGEAEGKSGLEEGAAGLGSATANTEVGIGSGSEIGAGGASELGAGSGSDDGARGTSEGGAAGTSDDGIGRDSIELEDEVDSFELG
jgi:hypothetical protein